MKRIFLFISLLLILLISSKKESFCQEYMPFAQSSYAGVSGIMLQPASIADSRYQFDMVLFGGNLQATNNYLALKREGFYKFSNYGDSLFWDENLVWHQNNKNKFGYLSTGIMLPSFMVNISENAAFAFTTTSRSIVNFDNVTEDLATLIAEDFDYDDLIGKQISNKDLNIRSQFWTEFALTYAQIIPLETSNHFLKGGLTLKYLQGTAAGYLSSPDFNFKLDYSEELTPDILSISNSRMNYGIAGNTANIEEVSPGDIADMLDFVSDPGFGMNIGFVYEYRPDIDKYKYNMDGREGLLRPDQNKYLLRIGVSLVDIGSLKYAKTNNSQDFTANTISWDMRETNIESIDDLNNVLKDKFDFREDVQESFKMSLPTALNVDIDYLLAKDLYINFNPYISLIKAASLKTKTHYFSTFSLTPRYDLKWFGAALPIQMDQFGRMKTGLALRLGPLWIGSNCAFSSVFSDKSYNADAYVMLKIPVFRNVPKDRDRDAVSNRVDMCPDIPGVYALMGCPDTDLDGITDATDECPKEPGTVALNGCPDRDGDGIADKNDKCPDLAGIAQYNGCPDSDGDGIIDTEDKCPDQAGSIAMKGCPDRDGDAIADKDDECPDQAGSAALKGCPDRDNDGISDSKDNCPDEPGKAEFGGCPFADYDKDGVADELDECPASPGPKETNGCPDTDGDGIADNVDMCPKTPGIKENNGCPEIKKEEKAIIAKAFSDLEFETGKAVIKASSYPSLNELAEMLKAKADWKVKLSGHTDNTGTPAKNMELSRDRANAVKEYFIGQGVEESKVITEWFGQERPVADNKTTAGRQKNRRVEMKIIFE
jgi:outer membrane protein OmpA-like peptidoglycan-associated protein